ncbi:MAG: phosphoenolpyruvate--protein phosphotransferase [Myxococcales bacterium]|nr:phosphoenolpyruvate--protein phosphotransferase [Myxococcales bacterium]
MGRPREELRGIGASPGVGVGPALLVDSQNPHARHHHIGSGEAAFEIERLKAAIERSRCELEDIRARLGEEAPADYRLILEAHLMMHSDELLIDVATKAIEDEAVNAEWAVERAVGQIARHLAQAPVDYFRDRSADVEHVGRRIIAQLAGRSSSLPAELAGSVLVTDDLHPADAAQLIETPVAALVTGLGSATSHTAILARTLEIPTVVGIAGIVEQVGEGDELVVDGFAGRVVLEPEPAECDRARLRGQRWRQFTQKLREQAGDRVETRDGVPIELLANVDLPAEAALAQEEGVHGIGLYRTEFLFMSRREPPSEDEQAQVYSDIVRVSAPRSVTLRTIDLGGDALSIESHAPRVPNPALGLRAIRLGLARPELFHDQLKALLRAAAEGRIRVMFPLISGVHELRLAKAALSQARRELLTRGERVGEPEVGVMIELPSAVVMADRLARECDFLSVGTNDLVQYGLAVDRANPEVAYLAESLDPAILRMLDSVVRAASAVDKPLSMCGDMAADALVLPLVLGLGYRVLSVPLSAVPLVREVVRRVDTTTARALAEKALDCATAEEVRAALVAEFAGQLGDLWSETGIEHA